MSSAASAYSDAATRDLPGNFLDVLRAEAMLTEVGRECRVFFQNLGYRLTLKLLVKGAQVLIQLRQSPFQEGGISAATMGVFFNASRSK